MPDANDDESKISKMSKQGDQSVSFLVNKNNEEQEDLDVLDQEINF